MTACIFMLTVVIGVAVGVTHPRDTGERMEVEEGGGNTTLGPEMGKSLILYIKLQDNWIV